MASPLLSIKCGNVHITIAAGALPSDYKTIRDRIVQRFGGVKWAIKEQRRIQRNETIDVYIEHTCHEKQLINCGSGYKLDGIIIAMGISSRRVRDSEFFSHLLLQQDHLLLCITEFVFKWRWWYIELHLLNVIKKVLL